jgi:hypothetical protein
MRKVIKNSLPGDFSKESSSPHLLLHSEALLYSVQLVILMFSFIGMKGEKGFLFKVKYYIE